MQLVRTLANFVWMLLHNTPNARHSCYSSTLTRSPRHPSIHPSISLSLILVDVVTAQDTGTFEMDNGIAYGYSSMQGWRKQHEDAHCADRDDDSGLR
jgi:hypothetical protein